MTTHWTAASVDAFVHRLSFDFITQLAKRLEQSPINQSEFAQRLKLSKGRVSQIFNNPGNLTLKKAVEYAHALGMKVSVVAYDDHDPDNRNGPINSEIFSICWEKAGRPADFQSAETVVMRNDTATTEGMIAVPERKGFVMVTRSFARSAGRRKIYLDDSVTLAALDMVAATNDQRAVAIGG